MHRHFPFFTYVMKSNPTLPKFYWEVKSQEQLIMHLCCYLDKLKDYVNSIVEYIEGLEDRIENLEEAVSVIPGMQHDIAVIKETLQALAQNALVYDVTTGLYRPSMATSRRMWQAGHYYGMTVEDYATYTVAGTADMTVRHVAVDGREVYMGEGAMKDGIPIQSGYSVPCFIPDDYIKKSDLTYIDSDNLQERTIMGVLDKDAETDLIKPTPYARPYTAHDLSHSWVLYNDHVVTDMDNDCTKGD